MSPKQSSADVSAPMSDSSSSNNMVILASSIVVASIILSITLFFTVGSVSTGMGALAKAIEKAPGTGAAAAAAPSPSPSPTPAPDSGATAQPTPFPSIDGTKLPTGAHFEGADSAKIIMTEFSDFQCQFCGKWVTDTYPALKTSYIDSGKMKFAFKNYPLPFHPNAAPAANAAECASEQGKFWQFHDKLFANQGALSADNYKKWATDLGLNMTQFNACTDAKKFDSVVNAQIAEGSSFGVNGTPTFFLTRSDNGAFKADGLSPCADYPDPNDPRNYKCVFPDKKVIKIVGAQPSTSFSQILDAELA